MRELDQMALEAGTAPPAAPLPEPAWRYPFFHAVRLLEDLFPDSPRLGERGPAGAERIRLRPSISMGFPAADLEEVRWIPGARRGLPRAEVTTHFLGLGGATSPLPRAYVHQLLLEDEENPQLRQFLDLFHHRLLSLLYRGWKRHHYERAFEEGGKDRLSRALLAMIGVEPDASAEDLGVEPMRLLRYLGLLLVRTRPAAGLEVLLQEELGLPLTIEQLPVRWVRLRPEQRFRLRCEPRAQLGRDVTIGTRRRDRSGQLLVHIGPVPYETFLDLWPGRRTHRRLIGLCRLYARQPIDLTLRVKVPAREVPPLQLSRERPVRPGPLTCLGRPRQDPAIFTLSTSLCGTSGETHATR